MTILEYKLTNDILCKMMFVKYPHLLKRLVSLILKIKLESIEEFEIINPEIPPEVIGDKFCRVDISMKVDGQRTVLEVQVEDEKDYPERSLYYWARDYSSALSAGHDYILLPRTIIINIIAFKLFECEEFHSEFRPLEVTRHTLLTDKQVLHFFELCKLPEFFDATDELVLWLSLFKAKTEEDLKKIEKLGVPIMEQAIKAYRHVSATDEFKEIERLRARARSNEAAAIRNARNDERAKTQVEVQAKMQAKMQAEADAKLALIVINALKKNMTISDIVDLTGETQEKIEAVCKASKQSVS